MTRIRRVAAAIALTVFAFVAQVASADPEVLAAADFESDVTGDHAIGAGSPNVVEEIYDNGAEGGTTEVENHGSGKRYRIGNAGASGASVGIRAPFAATADQGDVTTTVVVSAAQVAAGGVLTLCGPGENEQQWRTRFAFGADGKFSIHGNATGVSYEAGREYLVEMTVHLDGPSSADYRVTDRVTSTVVLLQTGHPVADGAEIGELRYATGAATDVSFSIDDFEAVR